MQVVRGVRKASTRAISRVQPCLRMSPMTARKVANRIRAGQIQVNGARPDFTAPFGGYGQSGNGREWGEHGFEEFLEVKAVMGYKAA